MQVDFLIVGQGLAGSALAFELTKKGKKIAVMSAESAPCASRVAAGLYNPITGSRLLKTWKADTLFDNLEAYYRDLERLLAVKFLHPIGIYRPFTSPDEQNDWMARTADPSFTPYIDKVLSASHASGLLKDPLGGLYLKKAGFIDTNKFLDGAKKYFADRGCFIEELFYENKLVVKDNKVIYGRVEAEKIVFCHGLGATEGNFFSWLPFQPLKGEILEAKPEANFNTVFNRGCFILPMNNNTVKIGSTYNWREPDPKPTEKGKDELLSKLNGIFKPNVTIVSHIAGVRPSTKDRRPLLGKHPRYSNVFVFNGLGTKGVTLAPHFASEMANYLTLQRPLSPEVDIQRFFSLYFERKIEQ